jgi:magnesium chelatase family protein
MAFFSATLIGVHPIPVEIEIDLSPGLPFFQIVGLPDAILRESKTRVKSAILQSGFEFPYEERVVLNLAPSKIKKEGSGFELGLALRILASSNQIPTPEISVLFLGELALDGSVKSVPEIEALSFAALEPFCVGRNISLIVVPADCVERLSHINIPVLGAKHLKDFIGTLWWEKAQSPQGTKAVDEGSSLSFSNLEFTEFWAKHLVMAAVGKHHYFLCGPPGCGKTFFAEALQTLMATVQREVSTEMRLMNSIFSRPQYHYPWAAPHHSASTPGILGGGSPIRPGAITRAHGGILFLDELLEFSPQTLDSLREPLEKGEIEIFRAGHHVVLPSRFQLIAATNPCRCGFWNSNFRPCRCPKGSRLNYQSRLSGPFFDRFDLKLVCQAPEGIEKLVKGSTIEREAKKFLKLKETLKPQWGSGAQKTLHDAQLKKHLNYRFLEKTKRLASTLALLTESPEIEGRHVLEAIDLQEFKGLESVC